MLAARLLLAPLQAATSAAWTVSIGPWVLPPQAWMPAALIVGALAVRTHIRARAARPDRTVSSRMGPGPD